MGVILSGIAVAVVVAIGAGLIMNSEQEPSWEVYSTSSARVGDPGCNLVGGNWGGNPGVAPCSAGEEPAA